MTTVNVCVHDDFVSVHVCFYEVTVVHDDFVSAPVKCYQ